MKYLVRYDINTMQYFVGYNDGLRFIGVFAYENEQIAIAKANELNKQESLG